MSEIPEGRYIIESIATGRYLFPSNKPVGGNITYPKCVGADANYLGRAVWKIIAKDSGTYLIQNEVTSHYLYQTGDVINPDETIGNWTNAPKTACADDRNLYQVVWRFVKGGDGHLLLNVHTNRYAFPTGQQIMGDHGSEEGWAHAPDVVGVDQDYYGIAKWKLIKQ